MTFVEAIQMGEYQPQFLSQYPEWQTMSKHVQLEYISKAIDIRKRQLVKKWGEIINMMDENAIPEMKQKMVDQVFAQMKKLSEERERIYYEYLGEDNE